MICSVEVKLKLERTAAASSERMTVEGMAVAAVLLRLRVERIFSVVELLSHF
jgi:hypothetical protein